VKSFSSSKNRGLIAKKGSAYAVTRLSEEEYEDLTVIVKALSGKDIPPLGVSEYGRLVAVTLLPGGVSSLVTLRYTEGRDFTG